MQNSLDLVGAALHQIQAFPYINVMPYLFMLRFFFSIIVDFVDILYGYMISCIYGCIPFNITTCQYTVQRMR